MKVLFIATDLNEDNGWGRLSREVAVRLASGGVEPVVLTMPGGRDRIPPGLTAHGFLKSYHDGLRKGIFLAHDFVRAKRLAADCDLIHVETEPFFPLGDWLSTATGKPLTLAAIGSYTISTSETLWRGLYRRALRRAAVIFSISRYTARRLCEMLPESAPKIRVVTPGVTVIDAAPTPRQDREKAFLVVGEVKMRKGVLQTVRALALVLQKHPDAKLYILGKCGGRPYEVEVRRTVAELGIEKNVVWLGSRPTDELRERYRRVRALVVPSTNSKNYFEGFGLVHLEANAFGTPAVGSLESGNEDAIVDGQTGFLIPQGDVGVLADRMLRLIDDDFDWDGMSAAAFAFARGMSWERSAGMRAEEFGKIFAGA